ncbi:histidine kinase [Rhizobacter sp. Root1221]|nr:histidine kinase [Rhizobacter sp. Root1221]
MFGPTGFGPGASALAPDPGARSAFDVCHVGVVLRAVLFVHAVVGVGLLFGTGDLAGWLTLLALAASGTLPAVLGWLVIACLLKRPLAMLPGWAQWAAAMGLGALGGAGACMLLNAGGLGLGLGKASELRWWAPTAAGAVLAAAMFYWLTLRARARLPADTTARLAELQSRIRPHFLFNTLNTAIALARLDPARTETLLEDLAELFRVALNDSGQAVTLSDEVALAQRYLAIEQVRFGDRLKVTWELDEDAGQARVPPLLLQPLVENAVRHGVEPSPEGGQIRIRTRVKRAHAVIVIVNTMPGRPSQPGNGIALRNVRERLRLMHDVTAQFEVRSDNQFFRVQVVVPL